MDLNQISAETLEEFKKAQTNGLTSGTGIVGVDLADLISLVPVNTPFRDMLARTGPSQGSTVAQWRALVDVNNQQPDPAVALDAAGGIAKLSERDVYAPYKPLAMGYTVTEDAIFLAKGYADAKAVAIFNALNQWKIGEDKKAIGAQNFALARPAAPTLADVASGGSIPTATAVYVGVAARTGSGYFYGGNSRGNSATLTTGGGAGHSVTATVAAVRGAVAYDWFVSADGATWYYYSTTTINKVTVTSLIVANQTVPTLPDLSTTVPTFNAAADNGSAKPNDYNGLLATLAGDYGTNAIVTPGTGTSVSGATFTSLDGAALTLSGGGIAEIDQLLLAIYNTVRLSPDALMLSSQEAQNLSAKVLGSNSATTFMTLDDSGRTEAVGSGYVGRYINRAAAGQPVKLEVHPHLPPGTIIARTDRVPFPNSNISNVHEVRVLSDVHEYVYGSDRTSGGPREDGETRSLSTYINRAPVACGVIQNILNG